MRITSKANERIKLLRAVLSSKKDRVREGLFAVEGDRVIREAIAAGCLPQVVLLRDPPRRPEAVQALRQALQSLSVQAQVLIVDGPVLNDAIDVTASVDAVALCPTAAVLATPAGSLDASGLLLAIERLQDPGNLGTLLRTAHAAEAKGIVLVGPCVDPLSPKVVRATAGSLFHVPLALADSPEEARAALRGVRHVGASARDGVAWDRVDLHANVALWLGGEAHGLTAEARACCDEWVHIPIAGTADSLNVAIAAAVLTFEHVRQRRLARPT